jgi:hypothetical protein
MYLFELHINFTCLTSVCLWRFFCSCADFVIGHSVSESTRTEINSWQIKNIIIVVTGGCGRTNVRS